MILEKTTKRGKINAFASSKICKRLLLSLFIFAVLCAVVVPTWQVYKEEGKSSTLISYKDPNIRGESLYISASVLHVDFSEKKYTINFVMRPNGTLANEFGQLNERITVRFSSIKSYDLEIGDAINPIQVTFKYDDGNEVDYPLDTYTGYFDLFAYYLNDSSKSIPISFYLDASITSFHFIPTLEHHQTENGSSDRVSLHVSTGRSTATQGFSVFICVLMWLLSLVMGMFGFQVVFSKRRADAHACMIGITTLFALPAVRSTQPGVPEMGCISDILGFYWNMAIVACSSIAVILCWVIRWERPLSVADMEAGAIVKQNCTHTSSTRVVSGVDDQVEFDPTVSRTSVLTCVEPSLRDV